MLSIFLFGPPRFERDGAPVHVSRRKVVALASYLARTSQPASRETLAALFWPEHDQSKALKSLRRELARLKRALGQERVNATRSHVAFEDGAVVDVVHFQEHLQLVQEHDHFPDTPCPSCLDALTDAEQVYADDFMAGFNLPDCPEFDAWQDFERESLRQDLGQVLHRLMVWHSLQGKHDRATHYGRRRLALDPLHEGARRALMEVYARAGQQAAALGLYDEGVQLLQKELGVGPAEETKRLWQALRAGRMPEAGQGRPVLVRQRRSNLPRPATPFVGRAQELTMIQLRLQEPACRLLTLVGPGGIGKTRLALEVGQRIWEGASPLFADGVFFTSLEAVNTTEGIALAMMEAAGISLYGNEPPEQQLLDYLRDRQMVFILDNLEHLLEGVNFITEILVAAPGVRILATSRAALRLQEEWFHPLGGLSVPPASSAEESEGRADDGETSLRDYDAIRLFAERARHASPTFSLDEEGAQVARICRLVEGMPLALELAAAWLKVLDAQEVADELAQGLDLLKARFCNLPERHQSIRAVFNQTWAMLDRSEREILARLSVFRGGFTQGAAMRVARAELPALSGLVEKSLLQSASPRRYRLHDLLRQFAAEKLEETDRLEESRAAHCRYYMASVARRELELKGGRQPRALKRIKADLKNVRLAWEWALGRADVPTINQALESIFLYFFVRGRNQQGVDFLASARRRLAPKAGERATPVWARIVSRMSLMASYMSPEREIDADIRACLAVAQAHDDREEMAFCHFAQGIFYTLIEEDAVAAVEAYERAREIYRELNETFYLAQVLIWMGFSYGNNSRLDLYFELTEEALALARAAEHRASVAHALGNLVGGAFCTGDYQTAEQYAHEVGEIGVELDLPSTITHAKTQLSLIAFLQGDVEAAGRLAREAHELAVEINHPLSIGYTLTFRGLHASITGDYCAGKEFGEASLATHAPRFGMIMAHWALAIATCGLQEDEAAWEHALTAIEMAHEAGFEAMVTWSLPVMAIVQARAGQPERAIALLALAQTHPLSPTGWQEAWSLLVEQRGCLEAALGTEAFRLAWKRGAALDLDRTVHAHYLPALRDR